MYSSRDWELFGSMSAESILIYFVDPKNNRSVNKFFIRYKTEEIVQSESIQDFCLKIKYPAICFTNGIRILDTTLFWYNSRRTCLVGDKKALQLPLQLPCIPSDENHDRYSYGG